MESADLAPGHRISRVIKGGWQLAGGHGPVDRAAAIADMAAFADAGITTFDCADIYTGVEALIGEFLRDYRRTRGQAASERIRVHTKYVPDLGRLAALTRADVARAVETSLARLGVERLHLVQFHWWDYAADRQVEVAGWLCDLRREGKIAQLGGTNFDTAQMVRLLDAGVPLVSMQVQYSLIDRRPARALAAAAQAAGVGLLCYGSVAGGLLSERWLGRPEPMAHRSRTAASPSTPSSRASSGTGRCSRTCLQPSTASRAAMAAMSPPWRGGWCWTAPGSRPSSWARATARTWAPTPPSPTLRSRPGTAPRWTPSSPAPATCLATSTRWSGTATARTGG